MHRVLRRAMGLRGFDVVIKDGEVAMVLGVYAVERESTESRFIGLGSDVATRCAPFVVHQTRWS